MCGGRSTTYGRSIGIGSNITAELCAIYSALDSVLRTHNLRSYQRVFIFSDCQSAIDLAVNRCTATHSFAIVKDVHAQLELLRPVISVTILWVPAHVGVPGNEAADSAARNAANNVEGTCPIPGQPLITMATSRALIKRALKQQLQQRWFSTVAEKVTLNTYQDCELTYQLRRHFLSEHESNKQFLRVCVLVAVI